MPARVRNHRAEWRRRKTTRYGQACMLRNALRRRLGGKCSNQLCGATTELEFHHPFGRSWEPRKQNLLHRMRLYWRDCVNGLLALLCSTCNARDGGLRGYWQRKNKKRKRRR